MPIQMLSPRIWSSLLLFFISGVFEIGNGARAAPQGQPFEVTTYHYNSLGTGWNAKETQTLAEHDQERLVRPVENNAARRTGGRSRSSSPGSRSPARRMRLRMS